MTTPAQTAPRLALVLRAASARAAFDALGAEWIAAGRPRSGAIWESYSYAQHADEIAQAELWA